MKHGARTARMAVLTVFLAFLLITPAAAVSYDDPHATVYTVEVHDNGDATWTVELRYQLVNDEDIETFEMIQEEFEEGNITFFDGIEEEMKPLAAEASNETGREMTVSGFKRDVRVEDTVTRTSGIASVKFNWTNFAEAEDGRIEVGDVFVGSGLVISGDERFVVRYDGEYEFESITPEPDINTGERLIWDGEKFFEEGQPSVVISDPEAATDNNGSVTGGEDTGEEVNGNGGDSPASAASTVIAGLLVLISGFVGGIYLSRRTEMGSGEVIEVSGDEDGGESGTETEILTDEDRIVNLLRENGGRMKQAEIVEETEWSKSKVSMTLSDMEDEERISKLRLGRENVIDLEENGDIPEEDE